MKRDLNILLIEDDTIMGESLMERFELEDFQAQWAHSGAEGRKWLARGGFGLVLSDLHLPDMGGDALFREAAANSPALPPWLFITGYGAVDQAVELLKLGAADYLTKPFDLDALVAKLRLYALAAPPAHAVVDPGLGISPALRRIEAQLPQLATQARTVLITGESGVGKEVVARAFHRLAPEGDNAPFIAVNCGAFPEGLLEAELFGHEKGAFTGAVRTRKGVFEQADGGTLFLDEIGDMPAELQTRLLRVLSDGNYYRVGGHQPIKANVRIIAATHQNLDERVKRGLFREDLFHRLNVIRLRLPPLRERREDIPLLAKHFLQKSAKELGVEQKTLSEAALNYLSAQEIPGNVRQLENLCHWLTVMTPTQQVEIADLPAEWREGSPAESVNSDWRAGLAQQVALALQRSEPNILDTFNKDFERTLITQALQHTGGRRIEAATLLGMGRNTLTRKIQELGMDDNGTV